MKKLKGIIGIIFLIIMIFSLFTNSIGCKSSNDNEKYYTITKVIDGDTYIINNGEKIRLIGVNTPEIHHPIKGVEYFGKESAEYAKRILINQKVTLKYDVGERDKYGRLLSYVYLADGTFVNALLVKEGYARIMTVPPNVKYADLFLKLEREARKNKRGLWSGQSEKSIIIKGNINRKGEKIYHLPGGKYYQRTKAERVFYSEEEARKADFRKSKE